VEALPDLLARLDTHPAPSWLVPGLRPDHGTILLHSEPREWKTRIALDLTLALAIDHGRALGLIDTGPAVPTWNLTDEDGGHPAAQRFAAMLAGAGLDAHQPLLHTSIGKGTNLDDLDWHETIIAQAMQARYRR
jgi:AAA domain